MKIISFLSLVLFTILCGCRDESSHSLSISFSDDRSKIIIAGIEPRALLQVKEFSQSDRVFQQFVHVFEVPGESDSVKMEAAWSGKLMLERGNLVFTPDQPFVEGNSYLVETVIDSEFGDIEAALRADIGRHLKRQSKILIR